MGKKVPEKRNIGMMANRYNVENEESLSWVAANALTGPANAMPVRTAAGSARIAHGEYTTPKIAITAR